MIIMFFWFDHWILGKAFDITYVRLKFHSPRPESFAIYKRTTEDGPWIPFQFYSSTCLSKYNVTESYSARNDETRALCSSEFSDISPLTGGNVIFTTLEGRPSAVLFENSPVLQVFKYQIKLLSLINNRSISLLFYTGICHGNWSQDYFGSYEHVWWRNIWWSTSASIILLCNFRSFSWWHVRNNFYQI